MHNAGLPGPCERYSVLYGDLYENTFQLSASDLVSPCRPDRLFAYRPDDAAGQRRQSPLHHGAARGGGRRRRGDAGGGRLVRYDGRAQRDARPRRPGVSRVQAEHRRAYHERDRLSRRRKYADRLERDRLHLRQPHRR